MLIVSPSLLSSSGKACLRLYLGPVVPFEGDVCVALFVFGLGGDAAVILDVEVEFIGGLEFDGAVGASYW